MACLTKALSMALVVIVLVVFCFEDIASAKLLSFPASHAHSRIRRALVAKRTAANCPNGTLASTVQDQIGKLSSISAQQGGAQQTKDLDFPGADGNTKVHVQAQSDQSGRSRSWSWSWSSHTSSSSSSDSSSSSSKSSTSASNKDSHRAPEVDEDKVNDSLPTVKDDQEQGRLELPYRTSQPQAGFVRVETKSSHSQHQSNSRHQSTSTTEEKNGKVFHHTSNQDSSSSSSSYSSSQFTNVFHYVVSGNAEKSSNPAPFMDASVQWSRSPLFAASFAVNSATGPHIARPAKADVCNRKFPFTGQQYTASDTDARFTRPFPKEALDPVSKIALDLHNVERERYGLLPLQWNADLANMASCWADLKAYGHSEDHFCVSGENIAMGLGSPCYTDPMEGMRNGIDSFLDEDRNWACNPQMGEDTGHWTQIVWKETRFVGCAVSQRKGFMDGYSPDEKISMYVVCEYYPPGNVQGEFERQVPHVRPVPQLRSSCSANERHGG